MRAGIGAFVYPACDTSTRISGPSSQILTKKQQRHVKKRSIGIHSGHGTSIFMGVDPNPAFDSVASSTGDAMVEFEPVLNVPALVTFVLITVIFAALATRTSQVEQSVQERNAALAKLRECKSKELDGDANGTELVERALVRYEQAVRKEERLRNVIPGIVRIVPPSAGNAAEQEAKVIAKQFLGKDFDIGVPEREKEEGSGRGPVALTVLLVLTVTLFIFVNIETILASL